MRTLCPLAFLSVVFCVLLSAAVADAQVKMPQLAVYVEDSQAAQDLLDQAKSLIEQKRISEAAAVYRKVMEEYPTKLARTSEKMYADVRRRVLTDVVGNPELLEAYRRLEEPGAQRALAAASLPAPNRAALEAVIGRYLPCPSGLEAGLRLAALYLEAANPDDAAGVLDELASHPDLKSQQSRWEMLQAAVGIFSGDQARYEKHLASLRKLNDTVAIAAVERWSKSVHRPDRDHAINPALQQVDAIVPENLPAALWTIKLPDPFGEGVREAIIRNNGINDPNASPAMHPVPVVHGERILINNGAAVLALDQNSGRRLWSYARPDTSGAQLNPLIQMTGPLADQRSVLIDDDRVVTVMGFAVPVNMNWQVRSSGTSLVCLRESDGQPLWRVEPGDADPALTNAYFHGTPLADHNRILVMARRNQGSGFQDAYVVALDAQTGRPIWTRYLSSAIATSRNSSSPLSQMVLSSGRLYISDNLGSVNCLESRNGAVVWLHVMPAQATELDMAFGRPRRGSAWNTPAPLLVEAGLIVASLDVNRPAQLLNPNTGELIRELDGDAWLGANTFFRVKQGILCVGTTVYLLDDKTLEEKWNNRVTGAERSESFRGRAAVTTDRILLPQRDRIVVLNLNDGKTIAQFPTDSPGSLLAIDGQIVVSDSDSLQNHLEWTIALDRLRREIKNNLSDPEPGLSLAAVAITNKQAEAATEGADAALAALRRHHSGVDGDAPQLSDARFQHAFDQLLTFAMMPTDTALRQAMYDRVGSIASTPQQEVAYQIGVAGFLADSSIPEAAVDHYQAVLADTTLSSQLYHRGSVTREAGMEARLRIADLIQANGVKVYAKYEAQAADRLHELQNTADAIQLLEVARQYPLSGSAPSALLAAANVLAAAGDTNSAIVQLRRVYNYGPETNVYAQAIGRLVEIYESTGRTREARFWLEQTRRLNPKLQPIRAGTPIDTATWLEELAAKPSLESPLPVITTPLAQPRVLTGRLLIPTAQLEETWPRDQMLIQTGGKLALLAGPHLAVKWETDVPIAPLTLISMSDGQAILWNGGDGRLTVIDLAAGKPLWPERLARPLLDEVGTDAQRLAQASVEERRIIELANNGPLIIPGRNVPQPADDTFFLRVNDSVICLGDRAGRLVGIERATGRVLWKLLCPMNQLESLEISEDSLVVSGITASGTDAAGGSVIVLDALTGEQRGPTLDDKLPAMWAGMSAEGLVLRVTIGEVVANNVKDATVAWRLKSPEPMGIVVPRSGTTVLFMAEPSGGVSAIQTATGAVIARLSMAQISISARRANGDMSIWSDGSLWHLMTRGAALTLDKNGKTQWRDAVAQPQKQFLRQLVGQNQLVLVSLVDGPAGALVAAPQGRRFIQVGNNGPVLIEQQNPANGGPVQPAGEANGQKGWTYKLYFLNRQTGIITHEQTLGPLRDALDPARSVFLDNALVLGTRTAVMIFSGEQKK